MEIIPQETGVPVLVQPGDFVTFPGIITTVITAFSNIITVDGFACYWYVIEPVKKHWYNLFFLLITTIIYDHYYFRYIY